MGKAITNIMFFTVLTKVLGFARELLLSYFFGATGISDAYLMSQIIPGSIFQFVGVSLATCFIPVYYKIFNENGKLEANQFTNKLITIVFSFSTIVMTLVWAATPQVVKLFASGFSGQTLQYAVLFTRIGICSLYFSTVIYVYNSYLQGNNHFGITAFAGIPNSIVIIVSILLGACWNLLALTVGSTIATAVQMIFLCVPVHKLGFRLRLNFHWNDKNVKHFFALVIPVVLGVSVNEINMLVDRTIASQVAIGGISALTYANSLIMFIQGGLAQPIATVCYTKMAKIVSEQKYMDAKNIFHQVTYLLLAILLPITALFLLYASSITQLLFGRGAFNANAAQLTATSTFFYALGIPFIGIRELLSRYYYAFGDTKTPMKNATIGMIINIVFNLTLSRIMGIGGLALSTSISAVITTVLMWKERKSGGQAVSLRVNWKEIFKILLGTAIMAITSLFVFYIFPWCNILRLFVAMSAGLIAYAVTAFVFKIKIAIFLIKKMKECTKRSSE